MPRRVEGDCKSKHELQGDCKVIASPNSMVRNGMYNYAKGRNVEYEPPVRASGSLPLRTRPRRLEPCCLKDKRREVI